MEHIIKKPLNTTGSLTFECYVGSHEKIAVFFRSYGTTIGYYTIENNGERTIWLTSRDYSVTTMRHKGYVGFMFLDWMTSNADEFDIVAHLKALTTKQCKMRYLPVSMWDLLY